MNALLNFRLHLLIPFLVSTPSVQHVTSVAVRLKIRRIFFFFFFLPNDRFSICKVYGSDYWLIIISYPNCRERSAPEKKKNSDQLTQESTYQRCELFFFFFAGKHGTLIQFSVRIMFVNLAILRIVKHTCQSQRNEEMPESQLLL